MPSGTASHAGDKIAAFIARLLSINPAPQSLATLAAHFTGRGKWKTRLPQILDTLVALGRARKTGDQLYGSER